MESSTPQLELVSTRPESTRMMFEEVESPASSPLEDTSFNPAKNATGHGTASSQEEETRPVLDAHSLADSEDESDLDIRKPVGRAARRMLGGDQSPGVSPEQTSGLPADMNPDAGSEDELYTATPRKKSRGQMGSSSVPASAARSTLFVSPAKTTQNNGDNDSAHELPARPNGLQSKLAALVAEKRAERLAREAEEETRRSSAHVSSDLPDDIVEGSQEPVDPEVERIMSDAARPTRKASKKALLEMERETQRMARQQALAHQMKTRKKFTTNDLFAKFNYRHAGQPAAAPLTDGDTSASSAPNSDVAEPLVKEPVSTPPSSPPTPLDRQRALVEQGVLSKLVPVREDSLASLTEMDDDEDLADIADIIRSSLNPKVVAENSAVVEPSTTEPKKGLKLARLGKKTMAAFPQDDSSDDDLEIIKEVPSRLTIFDKAKGTMKRQNTDSAAIHRLKHLAQIGVDDSRTSRRKNGKARPSMTPQALEFQLRTRAKEQARAQQLERIAELKAKGIDVQTAEEREREQEAFENLLEKARQDAVEIRKAEKAAAKEGGNVASEDESEDEDYVDGSGSENELGEVPERESNEMIDDLADESEGDEENEDHMDEDEDEEQVEQGESEHESNAEAAADHGPQHDTHEHPATSTALQTPVFNRRPRKTRVILDDDDESDAEPSQVLPETDGTSDDDPFAAFNFDAAKPASSLMSPTQMFNATMQTPTQATQQDSMDALNFLIPPTSSSLAPVSLDMAMQTQSESQFNVVPGSQPESQPINIVWEPQAPETPLPGIERGNSNLTLETPGWEPTQDAGLPETPSHRREDTLESLPEHDTQSTVRLRISESPAASIPKRNRLVRGHRPVVVDSDEDVEAPLAVPVSTKRDAFREMARKRKEALSAAELAEAEREAKQMMDEQAEESEDEYAGLGGDDYVAPENEQDREMIDSSHIDVNERELAAHFAERQRVTDEAEANKLYKDLMTGALRRKQANMFDLDEDEDDLAVRRRQMRQREEARKRKLLLQDDNIAGLAEGKQSKGKDAFLKAIADDDDQDDIDLSDMGEDEDAQGTQSDSQLSQRLEEATAPLREVSGNKRRLEEAPEDRPPAKQRRTQASAFRAPASLLEVKESVSFLLDEINMPTVGSAIMDFSSDSEKDDEEALQEEIDRQNEGGYAADRIAMPPPRLPASQRRTGAKPSVVDRLSLKRTSSAADNAPGRTAWAASVNGGPKVPSLLRRATTNNSAYGANDRGVSTSAGISRENSGGVKMGGSKKSSLAYQARDSERRAIVEASAKRRAENTARIAQLRRNASGGISKGMSGRFD